jgi:hypothetical protein
MQSYSIYVAHGGSAMADTQENRAPLTTFRLLVVEQLSILMEEVDQVESGLVELAGTLWNVLEAAVAAPARVAVVGVLVA